MENKKKASLSDRLEQVEKTLGQLIMGVNQRLQELENRFNMLNEYMEALVEMNGKEEVERIVGENRVTKLRAKADQDRKTLEQGIADGYVIPGTTVGPRSLLVGMYIDQDGKTIEPGRVQLVFPTVEPRYQKDLLDKPAGTVLEVDGGTKFELLEIYEVDQGKYNEFIATKRREAAQAVMDQAAAAAAGDEKKDDGQPAVESTKEEE